MENSEIIWTGSPINRVQQKDRFGCVVACIAMITGRSYEEIKAMFPNKDFSKSGIAIDFEGNSYLNEHGYLTRIIFPTIGYNQQKRFAWIRPFAPVHIVRVISESGNSHAVVMDMYGDITDPFKEGVFALSDYDVKDITGIWKIQ